jgi:hypothetical protein
VFLPGHDQKLRAATEERAGGVIALARLVDAAQAYLATEIDLETLGERVKRYVRSPS